MIQIPLSILELSPSRRKWKAQLRDALKDLKFVQPQGFEPFDKVRETVEKCCSIGKNPFPTYALIRPNGQVGMLMFMFYYGYGGAVATLPMDEDKDSFAYLIEKLVNQYPAYVSAGVVKTRRRDIVIVAKTEKGKSASTYILAELIPDARGKREGNVSLGEWSEKREGNVKNLPSELRSNATFDAIEKGEVEPVELETTEEIMDFFMTHPAGFSKKQAEEMTKSFKDNGNKFMVIPSAK
jgi:hypothetical protein